MKKLNGGFNTPAIVISRKKYKLYSVFTFITPSLGIIRASIPHKRMMTMRNSSYLRPFSAMYITVVPDGEYVNAVSYTHLDVYKRQKLLYPCGNPARMQILS